MDKLTIICPLCRDKVDRLLYRFHYESELVILEKIKHEHPGWTEADGICSRCIDYYYTGVVMEQRILPEIGPHFPVKSQDDYTILPTSLRLDADPRFSGKGVTTCFIDSGFYLHPDLTNTSNRIVTIIDITNSETRSAEQMWHGTMTSVVCAGDGFLSNGLYRGIASDTRLVLIKVQDSSGRIDTDNICKALEWVLAHHEEYEIRIVNMSLGADEDISFKTSKVDLLAEQLIQAGITVIAAVGNDQHGKLKPPANALNVISVGGINDDNKLQAGTGKMYHSTYGTTTDGLIKPELLAHSIWIAAPIIPETNEQKESNSLHQLLQSSDENFISTLNQVSSDIQIDKNVLQSRNISRIRKAAIERIQACKFISPHYMHVDGTSFAAPIVSSIVAQLLEINPSLTPFGIREILFSTAKRLNETPGEQQGYGIVQPRNAVLKALRTVNISKRPRSPQIDISRNSISFYVQSDCATQISLSGTFNEWERESLLFSPYENGIWRVEIPMLPNGKYHYKFFINDQRWIEDVSNPYREPDGFNGFNSVLLIESN